MDNLKFFFKVELTSQILQRMLMSSFIQKTHPFIMGSIYSLICYIYTSLGKKDSLDILTTIIILALFLFEFLFLYYIILTISCKLLALKKFQKNNVKKEVQTYFYYFYEDKLIITNSDVIQQKTINYFQIEKYIKIPKHYILETTTNESALIYYDFFISQNNDFKQFFDSIISQIN